MARRVWSQYIWEVTYSEYEVIEHEINGRNLFAFYIIFTKHSHYKIKFNDYN